MICKLCKVESYDDNDWTLSSRRKTKVELQDEVIYPNGEKCVRTLIIHICPECLVKIEREKNVAGSACSA